MIRLLKVVPRDAEISTAMIVEILAAEVLRRTRLAPRVPITALVGRVFGEELIEEDEALRQQVIDRILSMTEKVAPTRIQPKSVLTFLWAIHPNASRPEHFEMRAVRRRKEKRAQLPLELQETPIPTMQSDGVVVMP